MNDTRSKTAHRWILDRSFIAVDNDISMSLLLQFNRLYYINCFKKAFQTCLYCFVGLFAQDCFVC
jgi:hypothetical protein